jgi:hypothetical protein
MYLLPACLPACAHFASNLARRIMKSLLAEYKHRCPCVMGEESKLRAHSVSLYIYGRKKAELLCCNKDVRRVAQFVTLNTSPSNLNTHNFSTTT